MSKLVFTLDSFFRCISFLSVVCIAQISNGQELITLNHLKLEFKEISSLEYTQYKKAEEQQKEESLMLYKNGYLNSIGITVETDCYEICESWFKDTLSDDSIFVPSNYDQGFLGLIISPDYKTMMVYSSYDMPSFMDYYDWRSEFFLYNLEENKGLKALNLFSYFTSTKWSIDEIIWINNSQLALKVYENNRPEKYNSESFTYLSTTLP